MNRLEHVAEFQKVLADYRVSAASKRILRQTPLVVLAAPTSIGRNTIIRQLLQTGDYHFIVSDTTRQPRVNDGLPERDGLLVQHVEDDSPAQRAGLRRGDLLVTVAGNAVTRADDLLDALEGLDPDATLSLDVVRGVDEMSVSVRFSQEEGPTAEGSV